MMYTITATANHIYDPATILTFINVLSKITECTDAECVNESTGSYGIYIHTDIAHVGTTIQMLADLGVHNIQVNVE